MIDGEYCYMATNLGSFFLSIHVFIVIFLHLDLELVRNVEVYRARLAPTHKVTVYFLSFRNSVEEQIYLTSIQREKQAFEKLIEEKGTMASELGFISHTNA